MKNKFEEYLLKEYEQIASAHFNTINTISQFFRYYTILMATPIAIGSFLFPIIYGGKTDDVVKLYARDIYGIVFLILSVLGIFILSYMISLRHDVLLYARTVNGIRKFFYHNSGLSQLEIESIRVLPHNIHVPDYKDPFFVPVILLFALVDTLYFIIGLFLMNFLNTTKSTAMILNLNSSIVVDLIAIMLFFLIHFMEFRRNFENRNNIYLITNNVGVDIDGVINKHREQFCKILYEIKKNVIEPNDIKHIPVHESNLGIKREDEIAVFNEPRYWIEMPIASNASSQIEKLSSSLGKKVFVFTERPWPIVKNLCKTDRKKILGAWRKQTFKYINEMDISFYSLFKELSILFFNCIRRNPKHIHQITRLWLRKHGVRYDKLTIEDNHLSLGAKKTCRFSSSKKNIKYFIEDDPEKAIKLSMLCDFVFVIKHPYNESWDFPQNVLLVDGWTDLFKQLRFLSL